MYSTYFLMSLITAVSRVECNDCGREVFSTDYDLHVAKKCSLSLEHVRAHLPCWSMGILHVSIWCKYGVNRV